MWDHSDDPYASPRPHQHDEIGIVVMPIRARRHAPQLEAASSMASGARDPAIGPLDGGSYAPYGPYAYLPLRRRRKSLPGRPDDGPALLPYWLRGTGAGDFVLRRRAVFLGRDGSRQHRAQGMDHPMPPMVPYAQPPLQRRRKIAVPVTPIMARHYLL